MVAIDENEEPCLQIRNYREDLKKHDESFEHKGIDICAPPINEIEQIKLYVMQYFKKHPENSRIAVSWNYKDKCLNLEISKY